MELVYSSIYMWTSAFKQEAIRLRRQGLTLEEINRTLGSKIPKATFSYWQRGVTLTASSAQRLEAMRLESLHRAQLKAQEANRRKNERLRQQARQRNQHLSQLLKSDDQAKVALTILYLAEGTKGRERSIVTFGNSDPKIVALFLRLFRQCYLVDETKFRCTVQCRDDNPVKHLETIWSKLTKIPSTQFYEARIDPRSIGKRSKKPDYLGVCRIDYFDALVFTDLLESIKILVLEDEGR